MSEMIEAVRLVIHAGLDADLTVAEIARNVIEAMREPNRGMIEEAAGKSYSGEVWETDLSICWGAMIDGALK